MNEYNKFLTINNQKEYIGNSISNAQALVAKYKHLIHGLQLKKLSIEPKVVDWVEGKKKFRFDYICNGDSMFHVNKGMMGLRIENVNNVLLENVIIDTVINYGDMGNGMFGKYKYSHPKANQEGYNGACVRGLLICSSQNVLIINLKVNNCKSMNSESVGVDLMYNSCNCSLVNCEIKDIHSGNNKINRISYLNNSTTICKSIGCRISTDCKLINIQNIKCENIDCDSGFESRLIDCDKNVS